MSLATGGYESCNESDEIAAIHNNNLGCVSGTMDAILDEATRLRRTCPLYEQLTDSGLVKNHEYSTKVFSLTAPFV